MEFPALCQLNPGDGTGLLPAAEIFLEVKDIALCAGHIQFFWIDDSTHDFSPRRAVKIENKFLI
jgi:hypothetical protein